MTNERPIKIERVNHGQFPEHKWLIIGWTNHPAVATNIGLNLDDSLSRKLRARVGGFLRLERATTESYQYGLNRHGGLRRRRRSRLVPCALFEASLS